ncbi:MAG TPA: ParB/RepB/Spo0J family partition protein [Thermoanaerobaculia bacterium]|nr:ParB/RepB/Spo0J family partition protein [Thermoanaerobaculia bacterium]
MTATAVAAVLTSATIPLAQLRESPFNPRTQYLDADMEELQASITAHGVVQPILVRPIEGNLYEIVAGHRRTRAAKAAKLKEIPATIREMSDAEARQVQLIENAQRVDLAPLDEAEAYAALLETGMTIRDLAKTLSRKPSDIASRLTLVHLPQVVKAALASGLLPVEHAELIGRIPDESLQEQALKRFTTEHSLGDTTKRVKGVVPLAVARRIVETEFMTVLANAPFDPEDSTLSPLGKCSTCPARSGNNRDLFGDVRGKNVCTNLADFHLKITTYLTRLRDAGFTVLLSPAEIREAFPYATAHPSDRYLDLDRPFHDDPKRRTFDALLSDETKKSVVYTFVAGRLWRLFPRDLLAPALEASGHRFLQKQMERTPDPAQRELRLQQRIERSVRTAVATEFSEKVARAKVSQSEWIDLLARAILEDRAWTIDDVLLRHGYSGTREELQRSRHKIAKALIDKMSDAEKRSFVLDAMISGWNSPQTSEGKRAVFRQAMVLFGLDVRGIDRRAPRIRGESPRP